MYWFQSHRASLPALDCFQSLTGQPLVYLVNDCLAGVRLWWSPAAYCQHSDAWGAWSQNCFGDRSFSVESPHLWNALPSILQHTDASFDSFKCLESVIKPRHSATYFSALYKFSSCMYDGTALPHGYHTEKKTHAVWPPGQNGRHSWRQKDSDWCPSEWLE